MVSRLPFPVPGGVSTFPRVSREGPRSLARNIGRLAPKAANFGASLCSMNFQYPNFGTGPSRDRLRFRGDRFDPGDPEAATGRGAAPKPRPARGGAVEIVAPQVRHVV
jgi:hypothetical protein